MDKNKKKELSDILRLYSDRAISQISNNVNQWVEFSMTVPKHKYYRIKEEPKLVPFTFEDNLLFRDKWIYNKEEKLPGMMRILSYNNSNIHIEFRAIGYVTLLKEYVFEDGSPCGKYINE